MFIFSRIYQAFDDRLFQHIEKAVWNWVTSPTKKQRECLEAMPEQTHPDDLTPFESPHRIEKDREYSDFEKRRALHIFHEVVTQDFVEEVADDLYIRKVDFSENLWKLVDLTVTFDNSATPEQEDTMHGCMASAIRRRDAQAINYYAELMYDPEGAIYKDPSYINIVRRIAAGKAPHGLRLVKND
tara:strand:- start:332 stop:886 length:555 start_codon:yes stop_codon:yes gene_type:complete